MKVLSTVYVTLVRLVVDPNTRTAVTHSSHALTFKGREDKGPLVLGVCDVFDHE